MKIFLKFLLLLIVFLIPLQTAYIIVECYLGGEKWQYGTELLYVTQVLVGIVLVMQLFVWWKERRPLPMISLRFLQIRNTLPILLLCFVAWLLLSLIWSNNAELSWYYTVQILLAVAFTLLLRVNKMRPVSIAGVLGVAGLAQSLIIFWQWGRQSISGNVWLGISEKLAEASGVAVVLADGERWLRAYGTFTHPNIAGGFLAIAMVSVVWLVLHTISRARIFYIAVLPILVFALGLTFSRSAWLAMVCGVGVVTVYAFFKKISWRKIVATIAIIVLSAGLFIWVHYDLVASRIAPTTVLEQRSLNQRVGSAYEALDRIVMSPLLGTGLGTYTLVSSQQHPDQPAWVYQPAHLMWLLMLSEIGVVGTLLFITFVVSAMWRNRNNSLAMGMLAVLLVVSVFDHYLWTSWSGVLLWWAVILGARERIDNERYF
jgi:O-antigen ligase